MTHYYIASDHAGFRLKETLKSYLNSQGHQVQDLGTDSEESVDYPDYALKVVGHIKAEQDSVGILICGTGIGMSIAANRHPGVRAAVCNEGVRSAVLARQHNNANILCLGARLIDEKIALETLQAFIDTPFEGGRHQRRVDKLG